MIKMEKVVCGDIGGTHTNLSLVDTSSKKPRIVDINKNSTKDIADFTQKINHYLEELEKQGYEPREACFSIAGPINSKNGQQYSQMTNAEMFIDTLDLINKTKLEKVLLINDFEAISYATNILDTEDIFLLNKGREIKNSTRAVMGAGTGLGASILYFDKASDTYIPIASEGGHTDFIAHTKEERELAQFIREKMNRQIENEDVISGRGLEHIYEFLNKENTCQKGLSAVEISEQRENNICAKKTYNLFIKFIATACKNFALSTLCRGGLFIGGGIAAKNYQAFDIFMENFTDHPREQFSSILEKIPVWIITNYDISHLGAAYALLIDR